MDNNLIFKRILNRNSMERKGKQFDGDYPSFFRGVTYAWPDLDRRQEFDEVLVQSRERLAPVLLENLKKYFEDFGISEYSGYPYSDIGMKKLALHVGMGGRWIEVGPEVGGYFMGEHNLDAWAERAIAMNIGSDVIESLDEEILAPRVIVKNGDYTIRHVVPHGQGLIDSPYFDAETLKRLYEVVKLDSNIGIEQDGHSQRIVNPQGEIVIKDGFCEARGFTGWNIPKISWVTARLMNLYERI